MPNDRDGQHAGGSIVDTTRANMSPEQVKRDNEAEVRAQQAADAEEETGQDREENDLDER